ncbi:hypothetical protein LTR53_011146 [Teratosphaeriaceae sp. CCFEE 6253]|nr:hypothetical protein LTR53_011146 [Teratosphaeriaceae sp. CCFEE 6253]
MNPSQETQRRHRAVRDMAGLTEQMSTMQMYPHSSKAYPYNEATTRSATPDLLGLPAEVRNQIYGLVLKYDRPFYIRRCPGCYVEQAHRALLQVCRQTRAETPELYYSNNVFTICSIDDLYRWLWMLGKWGLFLPRVNLAHEVVEGVEYDRTKITRRPADQITVRLVLTRARVFVNGVQEITSNRVIDLATRLLLPAARELAKVDPEHQLLVVGTVRHCAHCASAFCARCGRNGPCCKRRK